MRSAMPVTYKDKPIELLREEVIDQLIMNYGHGEISLEAFERRLDEAYETLDHEVLNAVTADLSLQIDREYTEKKHQELGIHYSSEEPDDIDWMVSIMGGSNRAGAWSVPRELRIVTVMGGAELDFSEAQFAQHDLRIKVFCLMGGVDIKVPEQVGVDSKAIAIMGGVENRGNGDASGKGPRIIVEGLVLMGGISIKVKRPLRETWRNFADDMRRYFGFAPGDQRRA
jgi:hypothetical protein